MSVRRHLNINLGHFSAFLSQAWSLSHLEALDLTLLTDNLVVG